MKIVISLALTRPRRSTEGADVLIYVLQFFKHHDLANILPDTTNIAVIWVSESFKARLGRGGGVDTLNYQFISRKFLHTMEN
jgi:hypothetical protein